VKNFPHQINQLDKLQTALVVFAELSSTDSDLGDDGVVGRALARAGVYTFRGSFRSVAAALREESAKPKSNQGTRTCARDLRRLFELLRFLEADVNGDLRLAPYGQLMLNALADGSNDSRRIWAVALDELLLTTDEGSSHPYRILRRLAAEGPATVLSKLALALEARDDSEGEFARILGLANRSDWVDRLTASGVSAAQIANAAKILPALARQLGHLDVQGAAPAVANNIGSIGSEVAAGTARRTTRGNGRTTNADSIGADPVGPSTDDLNDDRFADPQETAALRHARVVRHQELVRWMAHILSSSGFALSENPFDILATKDGDSSILVEAKSLASGGADEATQVRAAIGQLTYYAGINVPVFSPPRRMVQVALFENRIAEVHSLLLEALGIAVAWREGELLCTSAGSGQLREILT